MNGSLTFKYKISKIHMFEISANISATRIALNTCNLKSQSKIIYYSLQDRSCIAYRRETD